MNILTHCPWCRAELKTNQDDSFARLIYRVTCPDRSCHIAHESRITQTLIDTDQGQVVRDLYCILTNYIVKIFFFSNSTLIFPYEIIRNDVDFSAMTTVPDFILPDKNPIILERLLELDFDNLPAIEKKIQTYVTFS